MGAMLPKPVESAVVESYIAKSFQAAVAEVNGWRNSMEDAHLIHLNDEWAFFGVFDGHGGDQCSAFVANQMQKRLSAQGCPSDDAAFKHLCLGVDAEFLATEQDSGSTGTMCVVSRPRNGSGKFGIRIANVGDSRILLGRRDGSIIDGGGTDQGLTTDHKPEHPSERERIYRTGGHVSAGENGGVPRVNSELSVSRCFGDSRHKQTGGPGPEDHPVTADPELGYVECGEADFLLLVCDGVSEGDFPNAAVVRLVASHLRLNEDLGAAAQAVCHKAIEAGSKDNISCMIVLLQGSGNSKVEKTKEFIPGQLSSETLSNKTFMTAYEAMAKRGGLTLAQAAQMRYESLADSIASADISPMRAKIARTEMEALGKPTGAKGSAERSAWFRNWADKLPEHMKADDTEDDLMRLLMASRAPGGGGFPGLAGGAATSGRPVRVANLMNLRKAVNESPAIEWDARMAQLAGADCQVQEDDDSDGTSLVICRTASMTAWLPTCALIADQNSNSQPGPPLRSGEEDSGKGKSRGGPIGIGSQRPPRLEQAGRQGPDTLARRKGSGSPDSTGSLGTRGTSPSTPTPPVHGNRGASPSASSAGRGLSASTGSLGSTGGRGASPSSNPLSQSGARFFAAPRLPAMPSLPPAGMRSGNRAPSPGTRSSSPGMAVGLRSGTGIGGRYARAISPIDGVGDRPRMEVSTGRLSRSVPPRPPIA